MDSLFQDLKPRKVRTGRNATKPKSQDVVMTPPQSISLVDAISLLSQEPTMHAPSSPSFSKSMSINEPYVPVSVPKKKSLPKSPTFTYVPKKEEMSAPYKKRFKAKTMKQWLDRQHHLIQWASVLADFVYKENGVSPDNFLKWEGELLNAMKTGNLSSDRERVLEELDPEYMENIRNIAKS
jgi:hypothetical protein